MRWKIYSAEPGEDGPSEIVRNAALIIGALDVVSWLSIALMSFLSASDPATKGLDSAFGWVATGLFAITGVPALALAGLGRAPRTALALAIAFPAGFILLFSAATIAFMM